MLRTPAPPVTLISRAGHARWRLPTASRLLAQAHRELGRAEEWRRLICELSLAREVSLSLARYLTHFVPSMDGQRSLLSQCLACGLDGWRESANARTQFDRFQAYLRGLLEPLPQTLEWVVCIRSSNGEAYWDPMLCGLLECLRSAAGVVEVSRRPPDSTFVDVAPADFRFLVLVRFLARRELRLAPLAPYFSELVCRYG